MNYFCGALTSKPYAFKVRPWELRSVDSVDVFDSIGSNIRIDFKGTEILRILPKFRPEINDFWISNKIRFFFDALLYQRLILPFLKFKGKFVKLSWKKAFYFLRSLLITFVFEYGHKSLLCTTSGELNTFDLFALKSFTNNLGLNSINASLNNNAFFSDFPMNYRFNSLIESLKKSNFALIVGCDTRVEVPTLNLQIRKFNTRNRLTVLSNGLLNNSTTNNQLLGFSTKVLVEIYQGKNKMCKKFLKSVNPIIFIGPSVINRHDFRTIYNLLCMIKSLNYRLFDKVIFLNPISKAVNDVGLFELAVKHSNFQSIQNKSCIFWTDPSFFAKQVLFTKNTFNICFSAFGSEKLKLADFLLPITIFVEQDAVFYNVEGRPQYIKKVVAHNNSVLNIWEFLSAFLFYCKRQVLFGNLAQVIKRLSAYLPSSYLRDENFKKFSFSSNLINNKVATEKKLREKLYKTYYKPLIYDFYKSHYYCESSTLMTQASKLIRSSHTNYFFIT